MKKIVVSVIFLFLLIVNIGIVIAYPNNGDAKLKGTFAINYNGANIIDDDTSNAKVSYVSTMGLENALLVSGGVSSLTDISVTKSGDVNDVETDNFGTNAGILVHNGAVLNINGADITTSGKHASGVYAYGSSININNALIKTNLSNSCGLIVNEGGSINAKEVNIFANGVSSSSIKAIKDSALNVDSSIFKSSSIVTLEDNSIIDISNSILNNNDLDNDIISENAFLLYQDGSKNNDFINKLSIKDSEINTINDNLFFITNTNSVINLINNKINNTGTFMKIGTSNFGEDEVLVNLSLVNQSINGDIVIDNNSTLDLKIKDSSKLVGAINSDNISKKVYLELDKDSELILTKDTYVSNLANKVKNNSNIYLNGYNLYVNGKRVNGNNKKIDLEKEEILNNKDDKNNSGLFVVCSIISVVVLLISLGLFIIMKKRTTKVID